MTTSSWDLKVKHYIAENGGLRLVLGILALVAIQATYLMFIFADVTDDRKIELTALRADVAGLQRLVDDESLPSRISTLQGVLQDYKTQTFQGQTEGIIGANIQAQIRELGEESNMRNLTVDLGFEETDRSDLKAISITVRGAERDKGSFATFLSGILSQPAAMYVSAVEWDARSGRFRFELQTLGAVTDQ